MGCCTFKSGSCSSGAFDQLGYGVAQLRTLALPVADALQLQAQRIRAFGDERIVEAYALNETTIAAVAGIGDDHIVKWTIL